MRGFLSILLTISICLMRSAPGVFPQMYVIIPTVNVPMARLEDVYTEYEDSVISSNWEVADFSFEEFEVIGTEDEQGNPDVEYTISGFSKDGVKKLKKKKRVVLPEIGAGGRVPRWIAEGAFSDMEIGELEIPGNYTHIQFRAFKNCKIKRLILHEGIVYANKFAFADNAIEEIVFPSSFRYAAEGAFLGNRLKKIIFPSNIESIGKEAFMNNEIEEIVFEGKVKHFHERAFAGNKLTIVEIPKSLRNMYEGIPGIHPNAFADNPGVKLPNHSNTHKVVLLTPKRNNPFSLENKGNFVVDPAGWEQLA